MAASQPPIEPRQRLSIVLPTFNERGNIEILLRQLLGLRDLYDLELLVVDDDSADGTADLVRDLAHREPAIRLIRRVGRAGLASAIKEGLLDATGDLAVVMDSDGQHQPSAVLRALDRLEREPVDLVVGSRFHAEASIEGLSQKREQGSTWANAAARFSLPRSYGSLTDAMSGFFALRLDAVLPVVRAVDVNGFKFLYELLAVSRGRLRVVEVPLSFQPRTSGQSKLDLAIFWDFLISLLHSLCLRLLPRRAISFALVGGSGVVVQLAMTQLLLSLSGRPLAGSQQLALVGAFTAACSNYLINNALTFRFNRLKGWALVKGLVRFLMVSSLPLAANVGVAQVVVRLSHADSFTAQLAGILVVFVWNYAASSRFVWNTP